ncbi:SF1B family DNA helicase RecD2 [Streptomyces cavernicola]|uniref:ATP-dependent RecD2 DNA helicase n=1 Tax=Streptomyces cavernicola TaxID=3043613 RepID=A0ABT6S458_9ACTN|nr:ATP-dependent RecD-like DNA helicase [Streptomyces sp. B-S-A6]MDI3402871.1 ATP-dependent RecD-like DNA helicase [Streptomyces sp. B-S-A6]
MTHQVPPKTDDLVEGVVDHLLHIGYDENTVLRLTTMADGEESVTALGKALFGVRPGENLRLRGSWFQHPRHGRQFRVEQCERTMPAGERAIRLYLASGLIRGIGPALASAIVDMFGEQTLKVIDSEPTRLLDVHNIGTVRLERITAAWQEQKAIAEIMLFLQSLGITPRLAVQIHTTYADTEDDPVDIVRRAPYRLCRDVHGVGFHNADRIALAVGVPKHSDERLQAALLHELDQAGGQGHCHLPTRVLLARTRQLLSDDDPATAEILDDVILRGALEVLCEQGEVVAETLPQPVMDGTDAVADTEIAQLARWHRDETQLAWHVRRLLASQPALAELAPWDERLAALSTPETAGLTSEQYRAVHIALTHPLSVLTGGPGCGKTHTLRTLTEVADEADAVVALAVPTGKAAKRLEETCGQAAMTVHRLIRPPDGDSLFDHASVLETADLVVVDEASMLDLALTRRLFAAVRNGCHLLLVGDIDQLPSVGPGRVLGDLLDIEDIPRTRLTKVFRQDDGSSAIVTNAHRILRGELPHGDARAFWNRAVPVAEDVAQRVVDLVCDLMPSHLEARPEDVQVLCPGKKNIAGMTDLNLRLQERLNPPAPDKPQHYHGGAAFRLGDRVQQIRNKPQRGESGVFNGSSGTITAVDVEAHQLTVTFTDGETATYPFADLDELVHAYALTVHRSQGSEYPYVIVPVTSATGMMLLQRNLLYTAVTRASRGVMLIGQSEAVVQAVANNRTQRRNTALPHRITCGTTAVPTSRGQSPTGQLTLG